MAESGFHWARMLSAKSNRRPKVASKEYVPSDLNTTPEQKKAPFRPDSGGIKDALRTLDEAIQGEGANLKDLVGEEYSHLRNAIFDAAPRVSKYFKGMGEQAAAGADDLADQAIKGSRRMVEEVDDRVRATPWPVIGAVAAVALGVGYWLGCRDPEDGGAR
jgi:ElaB/YqjD/DUF883 family membrane-anchored ribosome-binding protein